MTDQITSGALPIAAFIAALAGLVSFASPCVLPLVPGFLGYVTGLSEISLADRSRRRLIIGAVLFVLGFAVVFVLMSIFVSSLGRVLVVNREVLMRVGGVVVIALGLVFVGVGRRSGVQTSRTPRWRPRAGFVGAPALGAVFALGWLPCASPTLGAVLAMSASLSDPSPGRAAALATAYAFGLGLPFILAAAGIERFDRVAAAIRKHYRALQLGGGFLLVTIGVLMVTGVWESAMRWLQAEFVTNFQVAL